VEESPRQATSLARSASLTWRPVLIVVSVIVIDLIVVRFGPLSEEQYIKMIHAPITREDVNDPAKPQLYDFDARSFQLVEAAEVYQFKVAVALVIFTTLGFFVAAKQSKNVLLRSILTRTVFALVAIECLLLVTAAILFVELDGWGGFGKVGDWHRWLVDCVNAGWFGFVLIRLTGLGLVALAVRRLWRWSRTVGASVATLLIAVLTMFCVMTSYSPAGVYGYVDEIERWPDEDHYFRFCGGNFEEVHKDGVFHMGHYEKTADGWILIWADTRYNLKSSWFGIWQINAEFSENRSLLGRRIIPFLRPASGPNWLQ
jgi:hypothetical protein